MQIRKLDDLKKLEGNPRKIEKADMERLVKSIRKFGVLEARPLILSDRTGELVIIGGNMRYEACKKLGIEEVPTELIPNLTEEDEREIIIRDNVSNGDWDMVMLENDWDAVELGEWGVEVEFSTEDEPTAEEDDFEEDEGETTDIVVGDLFEIGEHRLLCGDSTNAGHLEKLMDGKKGGFLLTDPPYGIGISSNPVRQKHEKTNWDDNPIDKNTLDLYLNFTDEAIIFGGNYFELPVSKCFFIWDKKQPEDFTLAMCEFAWTNIEGTAKIFRHSVTSYQKEHPTQKPVELLGWCISKGKTNGIIIDPFLGSGSTMVASHQLGRKCYGLELSPKYCQTIVNRMIKLDPTLTIKRNGEPYIVTE